MTEVFELSENNFYKNIRFVQKCLKNYTKTEAGEIQQALSQASQELTKMNVEYSIRKDQKMKQKIDLFKDQLRLHKKQFNEHRDQQLVQQSTHSGQTLENEGQNDLGLKSLLQAKKLMYENEMLSNAAAEGIVANNEKLKKNIGKLQEINSALTIANKIVGSIKNKMKKNKKMLLVTVAMLLIVICFIVYTYLG